MPKNKSATGKIRAKEKRSIHKHWLQRYFFYQQDNVLTCLICKKNIRVPKKYNIQRHYETYHQEFEQMHPDDRKLRLNEFMSNMMEELQNAQIDLSSDFLCVVPKEENENDDSSYVSNPEQPEIDIFTRDEEVDLTCTSRDMEVRLFGQYLGEKLLGMDAETQAWAKREISEIIYQAEMRQLRTDAGTHMEHTGTSEIQRNKSYSVSEDERSTCAK